MPVLPVREHRESADGPAGTAEGVDNPLARLAAMQTEMLKESRWVGDKFTETARAIHSGEMEPQQVHGSATVEQAKSLVRRRALPVIPLPAMPLSPVQLPSRSQLSS